MRSNLSSPQQNERKPVLIRVVQLFHRKRDRTVNVCTKYVRWFGRSNESLIWKLIDRSNALYFGERISRKTLYQYSRVLRWQRCWKAWQKRSLIEMTRSFRWRNVSFSGISLAGDQWEKLKSLINQVDNDLKRQS